MRLIENITDEAIQTHTILIDIDEVILQIRYYHTIQSWFINVNYKNFSINGLRLVLGTLFFRSSNQPFDFFLTENSKTQIDPFKIDDFSSGRCSLFLLEREDMKIIRGTDVK